MPVEKSLRSFRWLLPELQRHKHFSLLKQRDSLLSGMNGLKECFLTEPD